MRSVSNTSYRRFFGGPNGVKPAPPKQTTLSFSSKSANRAKPREDDVVGAEEPSDKNRESMIKKEDQDVPMEDEAKKEITSPIGKGMHFHAEIILTRFLTRFCADSKKRSRDASPTDKINLDEGVKEFIKPKKDKEEEEEDDDEEPVLKRPRRNGEKSTLPKKAVSEEKPTKKPTAVESKDSRDIPPPKTSKKKEAVEIEDDEVSVKPKREASPSPEVASEVEEEVDLDEEEKPGFAAKAREKVQTTLKSAGKDPYPDWKPGEPVPYAALCTTFSLIELTTKRLVIAAHCSLFLRQVLRLTPDDLLPTVLLMINKLAADYAGVELGIGESLIMKAIGEATGRSLAVIKQDQKEIGDLGLVAIKSRANQPTMFKPKPLTVRGVHKSLLEIATIQGSGAQGRKVDGIKKLLSAADGSSKKVDITKDNGGPSEAKFVIRFLEGKLRLGLAEKTVLVSLAQAMVCHEIEAKGKGKVPSTEQLAKGEQILKAVFR